MRLSSPSNPPGRGQANLSAFTRVFPFKHAERQTTERNGHAHNQHRAVGRGGGTIILPGGVPGYQLTVQPHQQVHERFSTGGGIEMPSAEAKKRSTVIGSKAHNFKTMMARPRLQPLGQDAPPSPLPPPPPHVSLDRHSTTVTKVVEGCVYIRRPFYAIFLMRGELQHSALCSFSLSYNTTKKRTLVRPRGGQGIQAWTLRTH